jgi:hypothetical protein
MIRTFLVIVSALFGWHSYSQTNEIVKSKEEFAKLSDKYYELLKKERLLLFVGFFDDESFLLYGEDSDYNGKVYSYSLQNNEISNVDKYLDIIGDSFNGLSLNNSRKGIFYSKFFLNDPIDYGYSTLHFFSENHEYFLDSIYNADKKIHSSFSSDGRYLLVNTLNTLSDYYNPEQDDQIMVYDLAEIDKGIIKKEYIPCFHCSDSYLVGDQLFFSIGRKDGYDGFSNKDIYAAPWGSLKDSVKVADNTDILAISPDGKYILGSRFWDRQKNTAVIVDVQQRKYQMLLGRDYGEKKAFYSHNESKFAFDFKGHLIYVDFPKSYPFDALNWQNEEIPSWTEQEFWKKYEHPPLPDN